MTQRNQIDQLAYHVAKILQLIGLDVETDPELDRTPQRVSQLYLDLFHAADDPPPRVGLMENPSPSDEMVLVEGLPFYSMCVHHLIPFFGRCHIAYVPGDKITGFSDLGRVLRYYASQPQLQERLTTEIADHLQAALEPQGVVVWLRARQLCLEMRGQRLPGVVETTAARGILQTGPLRDEFFARIGGRVQNES